MSIYRTMPVPERIKQLRAELFAAPGGICFHRARIVTESYRRTEGEHSALRRAKALRAVFADVPIFIRDGELLVGQRSATLAHQAIYPEFSLGGLERETTPPEIWDYWHGRTLGDEVTAGHPARLALVESELAAGWVTGTSSGYGHLIVDYDKALRVGFRGIIAEAQGHLADAPTDDMEGRAFLAGVIIAAEGIITWANRYADLAEAQAQQQADPARADELRRIAEVCRRVPAEPARNFHEALQSFWFVHLAIHIEQIGVSISAGRFDQYTIEFFRRDLAEGSLTDEGAWELLLNLWVKFMENINWRVKDTIFQNLTLAGQDADGNDLSNELSHMCLDATVALKFNQPALSVRWHRNISPDFWDHVHRAIARGLGLPALFNDDIIIEALTTHGVDPVDAANYGIVGCVETCVSGMQQGMTAGGHINMAKALELAMNDGRSMISDKQLGPHTGDPEDFDGFDDIWQAYKTQVEYLAGLNILATVLAGEGQKRRGHCPLTSSLLDDCLANRRDLVFGGTRYNLPGVCILGPTNVYDGLTAIRKCVCEQKSISWKQLQRALLDDFKGHEPLRRMLAGVGPRFGNGDDEIDEFANRVNALHADFCWQHVDSRNGRYTCGVWPVTGHVWLGHHTAATPDGRHKGDPLVDGVGACQGADRNGPTALLQSVARLNNVDHWTAGNTCNVKFSRGSIDGPNGTARLRALTTGFMQLGGQELQINVVDTETLRAAQADPDSHADLIVRVAGFSAYFTTLGADVQEEIISRTGHEA